MEKTDEVERTCYQRLSNPRIRGNQKVNQKTFLIEC